ncbi:alpha/beta fold hydrolase [Pseudorhodoferax sp. Leaf274]|uniref:alpha/beta fold hydrolase n=1 Tax=Pseudorhodoferax sp. Leaf274 TaxID=1736318 RepID=UPI000702E345|nr:alpha/beta fold hydrolase [Pseudorhodoferax sp. Leaf274]KQP39026.1 alpha/beta hydrolase [Pseudorhodoferax sp. Leaf274]
MPVELAFESLGAGPPVVILHGLFGAGRNWTQLAQALAAHYRVILPDARNHGASPWAESMSYPEMAGDVAALIEREGLQQPVVVGHSMGGKTAMALALAQPQAIGALAVIDIAPQAYADQFSSYVAAMRSLDVAAATSRRELQQALATRLGPNAPVDFLLQNLRRHGERFDWRINLMATSMCMGTLCGFPDALATRRYDGPALFVHGADSDYVPPAAVPRIRALFPRARLLSIPDAGHWVHADQPAALLRALQDWLAGAH